MKKLIIFTLLLTSCCGVHNKKITSPKYKYDDQVTVYDGFYKGLSGSVYDYKRCAVELADGSVVGSWCYSVMVTDSTKHSTTAEVSEQELTK